MADGGFQNMVALVVIGACLLIYLLYGVLCRWWLTRRHHREDRSRNG